MGITRKIFIVLILMFSLGLLINQTSTYAYLKLSDINVMRHLPEKYSGGTIVVVALDIKGFLPSGTKIIEKVPDGWDLVAANPPLTEQPFRNIYVWKIPKKGEILTNIRYAVSIPQGNKSRKEFNGYIDIGSNRLITQGDRHIWEE